MQKDRFLLIRAPLILLVLLFSVKLTYGNRYNVSLSDLAICKEYRIEGGYVYRNFFLLENIENNRTENEKLRLKFYIMAQNNAHILLSPVDNAKKNDRVYEIVIGAGKNTFSAIRPKIGGSQVVVKKQNGLLNAIDPTPVILVQKLDGTLEVHIPTFVGPLLTYKDAHPLNIKYISFSSYGTTSARWFYDCKGDKGSQIEMETRNLTSLELLQEHLFTNYSIFTIPQELSKVFMGGTIKGVAYNEKQSIFKLRMELKLKWRDLKLQWNPSEFDNITVLRSAELNLWTPSLLIVNGASSSFTRFDPEFYAFIFNNGSIIAETKQEIMETWCRESDDKNWPWDELKCSVDFGVENKQFSIGFDAESGIKADRMSEFGKWHFTGFDLMTKNMSSINNMLEATGISYSGVSLVIHMRRNVMFYRKVFSTPLIASALLILSSFCMKRFLRGILNIIALVILLGCFIMLADDAPVTYVPKIAHMYISFLAIACFSYLASIFSRWLSDYPPETKPHPCILTVVNNSALRFILGMRFADAKEYLSIQHEPWNQLAQMLDRLICVLLFLSFAIIFLIGYN